MIDLDRLVAALGGADNIETLEPCVTRLRTEVRDPSLVDRAALRAAGCHGVFAAVTVVQVMVGPNADTLASDLEETLWGEGRQDSQDPD